MLNKIGIFLKKILRALNLFTKSFANMFLIILGLSLIVHLNYFQHVHVLFFFEVKFLFDFL